MKLALFLISLSVSFLVFGCYSCAFASVHSLFNIYFILFTLFGMLRIFLSTKVLSCLCLNLFLSYFVSFFLHSTEV